MTNILIPMVEDKVVHPPAWLPENTQYLVKTGSVAYGCSLGSSDTDVVGFSIPPKEMVFPHLAGYIDGFGTQKQRFDVWQQHHIEHKGQEYDFSVYSIVRYFHLCLENNPNMVDTLYVPANCVIHCTELAARVREKRDIFLSKRAWHKFKGYAFSNISRCVSDPARYTKSRSKVEAMEKKYGVSGLTLQQVRDELARRRENAKKERESDT